MSAQVAEFLHAHSALENIDLLVPDINGIVRGKRLRAAAIDKAFSDGIFLPQSLFGSDVCGDTVDETRLGIVTGDQDLVCRPEADSLRLIPWVEERAAQCLFEMYREDGLPFPGSPRQRLREVIARLHQAGLYPTVAVELEFYLFRKGLDPRGRPQLLIDPTLGEELHSTQVYSVDDLDMFRPFIETVQRWCEIQQVPATTAVAEYAPGQFEINLDHCDDPLAACDNAMYLKRIIRRAASQHDMIASFMAKPMADYTGSGTHIHVSLGDAQGSNRLASEKTLLHQAVGGMQETMAQGMLLWAPHANSYRRFQRNAYVPLSPTWGYNNRTVALRIPIGDASSRRVEHRVAGADVNPHLVMAGVLAGIAHGCAGNINPDAPMEGDAATQSEPSLPLDWRAAINRFTASDWARDYLGNEFVDLMTRIKRSEYERYRRHVAELDIQWYLTTV